MGWMLLDLLKAQGMHVKWHETLPEESDGTQRGNGAWAAYVSSVTKRPGARQKQLAETPIVVPPVGAAINLLGPSQLALAAVALSLEVLLLGDRLALGRAPAQHALGGGALLRAGAAGAAVAALVAALVSLIGSATIIAARSRLTAHVLEVRAVLALALIIAVAQQLVLLVERLARRICTLV